MRLVPFQITNAIVDILCLHMVNNKLNNLNNVQQEACQSLILT